jgi:hypothetical protein
MVAASYVGTSSVHPVPTLALVDPFLVSSSSSWPQDEKMMELTGPAHRLQMMQQQQVQCSAESALTVPHRLAAEADSVLRLLANLLHFVALDLALAHTVILCHRPPFLVLAEFFRRLPVQVWETPLEILTSVLIACLGLLLQMLHCSKTVQRRQRHCRMTLHFLSPWSVVQQQQQTEAGGRPAAEAAVMMKHSHQLLFSRLPSYHFPILSCHSARD